MLDCLLKLPRAETLANRRMEDSLRNDRLKRFASYIDENADFEDNVLQYEVAVNFRSYCQKKNAVK